MSDPIEQALKLQLEASKHGFDWSSIHPVLDKLEEEINEIKEELKNEEKLGIEEEFGDLLFQCLNLSRHLKINPKEALTKASSKFQKRFMYLLDLSKKENFNLNLLSEQQLIDLWNQSKKIT